MSWQKRVSGLVMFPALILMGAMPTVGEAYASISFPLSAVGQLDSEWQVSLEFPPSQDRGAPLQTGGGGSRLLEPPPQVRLRGGGNRAFNATECVNSDTMPLTPLMPTRSNLGKTINSNPSLFFYVPKTTAKKVEFVLVDEQKNEIYRTLSNLKETGGILQLKLPQTVALEVGQNYYWELALVCNSFNRRQDKYVQGTVIRTQLNESQETQLTQQTEPLKRASIYAENEIWIETLETLAAIRSSQSEEWKALLESVGLSAIADQPFLSE